MSYVAKWLQAELVHLDLRGRDAPGVLGELVALVPESRGQPAQQETFIRALLDREKQHSTAIGDGIALPHARTLCGLLHRPFLIFGRHAGGIPYGAPDLKPVHLFFLVASQSVTDHLAMLARLSRVLRDPKLRVALMAAKQPADAITLITEAESRTIK